MEELFAAIKETENSLKDLKQETKVTWASYL